MSKSLGNIILPSDIIKKYGADILRMWVASFNFTEDLKISFESLNRLSDSYRKIKYIKIYFGKYERLGSE